MRRDSGRPVDGIFLLDKPAGLTSNKVLQKVKHLFRARKAGHTGSLDPFATGMLPICLGSATKAAGFLLDSSKEYAVTLEFGRSTATGDIDGDVIDEANVDPIPADRVEQVLASFVGDSTQIPPMYSALKHEGRRLYDLARKGITVALDPRPIRIEWIRLEGLDWPRAHFAVRCSKGTYIRSLATDIAARLGTIGFVSALRRVTVDPFGTRPMTTIEALEATVCRDECAADRLLLPPDAGLARFDGVYVDPAAGEALVQGRAVPTGAGPGDLVRIYAGDVFIGLGSVDENGSLRPRRIFVGR